MSEIDAIKNVDSALAAIDPDARKRVLEWAWKKYVPELHPSVGAEMPKKEIKIKEKKERVKKSPKIKTKLSLSIDKDLNLRPKGKKSFVDFAKEKQPVSYEQKCTVAVYYLEKILGIKGIGINHIYTCYKDAVWRVPADLRNKLHSTASKKGWLDTGNIDEIKLTTRGDNLIEHDLPPKAERS